jgi:Mn-dependent DtxR family transcriptional regulator
MTIHESAENYLETILILEKEQGTVRSIDIVNELDFSRPSVSVAMKKLRESGYIDMGNEGSITLTATGREIAERMYERHTLLTAFLVSLGVDERTAVDDACRIEHIISQQTFEKISEHTNKHLEAKGT